jgi:hypothetical protein
MTEAAPGAAERSAQMQAKRLIPVAVAIAAVVVLFIVLSGDDDDSDSGPVTITVENGQPVGGVQEIEVQSGDHIRFTVDSDVDEEVHLHGYDIAKDVEAGGSVEYDVPATIEGRFEVELEHSKVPLAEISVTPG